MVYVLKMEYVSKINIFGLKMVVKSGLEKMFLKSSFNCNPFLSDQKCFLSIMAFRPEMLFRQNWFFWPEMAFRPQILLPNLKWFFENFKVHIF